MVEGVSLAGSGSALAEYYPHRPGNVVSHAMNRRATCEALLKRLMLSCTVVHREVLEEARSYMTESGSAPARRRLVSLAGQLREAPSTVTVNRSASRHHGEIRDPGPAVH